MILEGTFENKPVRLRGWLHNRRSSGGIQFILLRDGSGTLQCTIKKDAVDKETFDIFDTVPPESTIQIEGIAKKDSRAPGGYEVSIQKASVYRAAEENFPIAQKYHGPEFLLDNRHLWIRNRKMQATLRIRASVLEAGKRMVPREQIHRNTCPDDNNSGLRRGLNTIRSEVFRHEGVPDSELAAVRRSYDRQPRKDLHNSPIFQS